MYSMWNAPSDRDYYGGGDPEEPKGVEPEEPAYVAAEVPPPEPPGDLPARIPPQRAPRPDTPVLEPITRRCVELTASESDHRPEVA